MPSHIKTGYVHVVGGRVWYKRVGKSGERVPLVIIHGGPGYPHNYLTPIEKLSSEREVVLYDQLGCGKSDRPADKKLWTVKRSVAELKTVLAKLGLKKYHLLGHSWGATLAASLALEKQKGLAGIILADPYLSTRRWMHDAARIIKRLPPDAQKHINRFKKDGVRTKKYEEAALIFYKRFVRMYEKRPKPIIEARKGMNNEIYAFMWGPEEFMITGTLRNFDLMPRLPNIRTPTLLLCGRFDEATPESAKHFQRMIPNAEIKIFEKSAHFPHLTETKEYLRIVESFLEKND